MKLDRTQTTSNSNDFPVLQPGEYDFQVMDAVHKLSSSGNRMWELKLRFEQDNGPDVNVFEYLVEADADWSRKKFNSYLDSIGSEIDESEKLADTIGEIGRARVKIEKGTNGYSDRNKVDWFIPKKKEEKPAAGKQKPVDDLPF